MTYVTIKFHPYFWQILCQQAGMSQNLGLNLIYYVANYVISETTPCFLTFWSNNQSLATPF